MKKMKFKHSLAKRMYWRKHQRSWRAKNPERAQEIRKRYFRKKRGYYLVSEKKDAKKTSKK